MSTDTVTIPDAVVRLVGELQIRLVLAEERIKDLEKPLDEKGDQ